MDEDTKKLLENDLSLNKENNHMLRKLVSYQKWNQIYRIFYWTIIILSAAGAFYYLQPYFNKMVSLYTGGMGNSESVQKVLKSLNN